MPMIFRRTEPRKMKEREFVVPEDTEFVPYKDHYRRTMHQVADLAERITDWAIQEGLAGELESIGYRPKAAPPGQCPYGLLIKASPVFFERLEDSELWRTEIQFENQNAPRWRW